MFKKILLFVIENRILFAVIGIVLLLFSLFNIGKLNIEPFPDPSPVVIETTAVYNGRSAEEVERQVTIPLETALSAIPHAVRINTMSIPGLADVKVTFDYDISHEKAKQYVINRLPTATLPPGVQPGIQANIIGEIMRLELRGKPDTSLTELRGLLDGPISRQVKTVPGVEDFNTLGGYVKEYQILVDPKKAVSFGVPLSQIISTLQGANSNVGGNYIEQNDKTYTVRGLGLIHDLEDIKNTGIVTPTNLPAKIGAIAEVQIDHMPVTGYMGLGRNDGERYNRDKIAEAVVVMRKDAQSIPTIKALNEKIKELNIYYASQGIQIVPYYERGKLIDNVVHKILETGLIGIALVTLIIILFLGDLVTALIVASIIPISFLVTLALMAMNGESANLISLGAVDFGIIADVAILYIESVFRLSKNNTVSGAIVAAGDEIGKPLLFSIAIIITSFIPLFTMNGAEGILFTPMAKTYVYALTFAVILTFMFLPAMLMLVKKKKLDHKEIPILRSISTLYQLLLSKLLPNYKMALTVAAVAVSLTLASAAFLGTSFMPVMDEGNIYIRLNFPYDIALTKSHENANKVRNYLLQFPEVATVDSRAGRPEGGTDTTGPYDTEYNVILKPYSQWPQGMTKEKLEETFRKDITAMFPEGDINFSQYIADNLSEVSSGVKGENAVKIYGRDLKELEKQASQVGDILKTIPGISDVGVYKELGQPNITIELNRSKVASYGLNVQDMLNLIDMAVGSSPVTLIYEGEETYDLDVLLPTRFRNNIDGIKRIPILLPDGSTITMSQIANIYSDQGAFFIYREDYKRFIPIKFSIDSTDIGGTVQRAQQAVQGKVALPPGYSMTWSGTFKEMRESQDRLLVIVPIAILITLVILFVYFKSLRYTLTAFASAVFAMGSGILGLLFTGTTLSVSSVIGFISIMGVSVMNGTVIVAHFLNLCKDELAKNEAVLETMRDKFKPVLMTGLVAALGLLPAALATGVGSQVQKPLAIVVVSGLIIGTLATLFILPLILRAVPLKEEEHDEFKEASATK